MIRIKTLSQRKQNKAQYLRILRRTWTQIDFTPTF